MTDKSHELLEAALDHLHGMNSYEDCLLKNRIRAYLSNTSNDAEEPTKIKIAAEREDIDWQSNEGAVYLFAGWLTTRDTVISCGRTENASPMAEAIKEYKAEWPERFTKLAEPEVKREALSEDEVKNYLCRIPWMESLERVAFKYGVRFAEKHHGIVNADV